MKYVVLAADDEVELLDVLELYLEREEISLLKAENGLRALELFSKEKVDMVLLDIMMPGLDGFKVLQKIREVSGIPAIMLSAKGEDYDKILGLNLGADDYITKPFNPLEVTARVKAQLRRAYKFHTEAELEEVIAIGDLCLNQKEGFLYKNRDQERTPIELTSTEFKIISMLMASPGRIYTKKQIFEHVWQDCFAGDDNTIMVHLSNIRNKIEEDPKKPEYIKTVKGLGYKFENRKEKKQV